MPGMPSRLQPDAGAPTDQDDGLSGQFRFALAENSARYLVITPPIGDASDRSPAASVFEQGPALFSIIEEAAFTGQFPRAAYVSVREEERYPA